MRNKFFLRCKIYNLYSIEWEKDLNQLPHGEILMAAKMHSYHPLQYLSKEDYWFKEDFMMYIQ